MSHYHADRNQGELAFETWSYDFNSWCFPMISWKSAILRSKVHLSPFLPQLFDILVWRPHFFSCSLSLHWACFNKLLSKKKAVLKSCKILIFDRQGERSLTLKSCFSCCCFGCWILEWWSHLSCSTCWAGWLIVWVNWFIQAATWLWYWIMKLQENW